MLSWSAMLARGDPGWFFFVILGVLVYGVIAIVTHTKTQERRNRLALRLGGRYERGGIFSNAAIHFSVAERSAILEFQGGRSGSTRLYVPLPASAPGTFKVTTVEVGWGFLRLVGYDSVRVGDPAFDKLFAVTGDRGLIRRVFDPESRDRAMAAVRRLGIHPGFSLDFDTRSLQIRFSGILDDEGFVGDLKRSAEDLVAIVFGPPPATGIEWGEIAERPAGLCPICTTVLTEPVIRCRRCRAPHHRECWEYLGRCAVYGCEPRPGQRAA